VRKMKYLFRLLHIALMLTAGASAAYAQGVEPRAYSNAPVGVNFLIGGYGYTQGGLAFDPSLPVKNPHLETSSVFLAYVRTLDFWGKSGKVAVITPYSWLSGSADFEGRPVTRVVNGFADPTFRLSVNLYGAPALTAKEFAEYKQDLIIGASLYVTPPLGQYDPARLVNIGANRWSIAPEVGLSKALGPCTLEVAAAAAFYTENTDFFGGNTRTQDPLFLIQGHAIYNFRSGVWVSLDGTYFEGGSSSINNAPRNDFQENWRVGGTVALPINAHNSIKLFASSGVSARTGNNYDQIGIAWQHLWGGGL